MENFFFSKSIFSIVEEKDTSGLESRLQAFPDQVNEKDEVWALAQARKITNFPHAILVAPEA